VTTSEYRLALDALPYGKRLPGAVYLLDPGDSPEIPSLLRITVAELRRRLEIGPEFNLLKFHLHSRKLTFHYYQDFEKSPLPELLTRIKIDLKRLFVTVIDHTTGPEHQLLFFKERFLAKDHPDRAKMDRFSAKLRKLGLREETIGHGPSKEAWNSHTQAISLEMKNS
jgi:hypothetical protein